MKYLKIVFVLVMSMLATCTCKAESVEKNYEKTVANLEDYANDTMQKEIDTWINVLVSDKDMGLSEVNASDIKTSKPFFIYNVDKKLQNATIYYPLTVDDKIVGIFSMTKYKGTWNFTVTGKSEQTDILNQIDYVNNPVVFYVCGTGDCGDVVEVSTAAQTLYYVSEQLESKSSDGQKKFRQYSFEEKMEQIANHTVLDDGSQAKETSENIATDLSKESTPLPSTKKSVREMGTGPIIICIGLVLIALCATCCITIQKKSTR